MSYRTDHQFISPNILPKDISTNISMNVKIPQSNSNFLRYTYIHMAKLGTGDELGEIATQRKYEAIRG